MGIGRTEEFRSEAVRIALTSGLSHKQVAADLGIGLSTLGKWITSHKHTELLFGPHNGIVTLLNGRAANWHRTQAQAAAVAVCHRPIAWLRNWRNVFRDIRWRWTLKVL